jgi:hypothetical protein
MSIKILRKLVYIDNINARKYVSVAQWIARRTSNPEAVGSSPTGDA